MSEEDLENLLKRHTKDLTKLKQLDGKKYSCYVDGEEEYEAFITDLSAVGFSFYTRSAKANESSRALFSYAKKEGDLQIPFFGSPFQILKSSYMYCSMDGNYKPTTRPTLSADQPSAKKFRFSNQPTKKVGCQAIMRVKCLRIFNEDCYKLATPYKRHCRSKNKILSQLGADISSDDPPASIIRFMMILSAAEEHNHSVVSTNHNQRIHPRLKEEIYNLVRASPDCTTKAVKSHLSEVVRAMFEESGGHRPDPGNRCYYPIDHVIRFHVYQAHAALDRGGYDQDALAIRAQRWIREYPEDDFYFRPRAIDAGGGRRGASEDQSQSSLLFCHQTKWQRHLLRRYGDEICLLDAAHKTCRYAFPLYFLVVRTNAGDFLAGTLVVQRENADLLSEALAHFRAWNVDWDPEFFLAGHSDEETEALGRTFPRSAVYTSAFHRERAWDAWLNKKGNVSRRSVAAVRSAWQTVAASRTEDEYTKNLQDMYELEACRDSPAAQSYFFANWLPSHRSWVEAFQRKDFVARVNINNDAECRRATLQHADLVDSGEKTLSGVVGVVVEKLLADQLERYAQANIPVDHREFTDSVPGFIRDRPIPFIENMMLRYEQARSLDHSLVNDMSEGMFMVRGDADADDLQSVDFLDASCTCDDFASWRVPCVHMCAVFLHVEGWGFDDLPEWYRDHPYVTVDGDYAGEVGVKIDFEGDEVLPVLAEVETCIEEEEEEEGEEEEEMEEGLDVETLMERTREKLLTILGYTYLEHDADDALRFSNAVLALDEAISGGDDEERSPGDKCGGKGIAVNGEDVKRIKTEPLDKETTPVVPQRIFPKLKIGKKNVGRCEVPPHQWREYITDKVDVYPPQTIDQIVVIDVNHRPEKA